MNLLLAEWIRIRSIRSTWIMVAATILATAAISALGISGLRADWITHLPDAWDPTAVSLKGILVGQLLAGMLGAATITGEYSTGMIATSLSIVPRRSKLLAAKAAVAAAVAAGTGLGAVALSFGVGQVVIAAAGLPAASIADPAVVRALLCAVGYLVLSALLGLAFGAITRSSSGALGILVAIELLAPALLPAVPGAVGSAMSTYWPTTAGQESYAAVATGAFPPLVGIGIMALFTLYLTMASHLVLRVRDA